MGVQLNMFALVDDNTPEKQYRNMLCADQSRLFAYYDKINADKNHIATSDDVCTPMACVERMLDYIPKDFWKKKNIRILDPCCGNGNFGAYCKSKTSIDNIWFNDINKKRVQNCKKILSPKNILNKDALEISSWNSWDLIMANPPYSGGGNKNRSLSNIFIEHSIDLLKDGGYLCFVTPNNWMTYNNNNTTLKKLLAEGSFLVIDNDVKKYFKGVGSSFVVFVWQKNVFNNRTYVKNNYIIKDEQFDVEIPNTLPFIPLYISQQVISIVQKTLQEQPNSFKYRCDLHNFTKKELLSDIRTEEFCYETIHTARKTRYSCVKQDIYDKWLIIVPLSTYYVPYIRTNVNLTQSVGYFEFSTRAEAEQYMERIIAPCYKLIVHLTRYGNFNNIMVLKHLRFDAEIDFTPSEIAVIQKLMGYVKY